MSVKASAIKAEQRPDVRVEPHALEQRAHAAHELRLLRRAGPVDAAEQRERAREPETLGEAAQHQAEHHHEGVPGIGACEVEKDLHVRTTVSSRDISEVNSSLGRREAADAA